MREYFNNNSNVYHGVSLGNDETGPPPTGHADSNYPDTSDGVMS